MKHGKKYWVYSLTNKLTNEIFYIGCTRKPRRRKTEHLKCVSNTKEYIKKIGSENVEFNKIVFYYDREEALLKECELIANNKEHLINVHNSKRHLLKEETNNAIIDNPLSFLNENNVTHKIVLDFIKNGIEINLSHE